MPYTLSMAFMWVTLAVLLGIAIGWLMRSVVAKRQIERARSNHLDNVELERLRTRIAELEPERDALRAERDSLRSERDAARAELERLRSAAVAPEPDGGARPDDGGQHHPADDTAAAAVGPEVTPDDLTVIQGIGPKVAELCSGIGITTWNDLAATEVSLLRTMLHDAGPRFRTHDPSTWPQQARLLADGRWDEFRALSQELAEGRVVD